MLNIVETLPELASPSLSSLSSSSSSSSSSSPSPSSILWSSLILGNNPEPAQYSPSYPLSQYPQYSNIHHYHRHHHNCHQHYHFLVYYQRAGRLTVMIVIIRLIKK
ncbi:uncharacterized protein OCT59_020106 [Rhizophagus irregularis]|uniref:uncharacterized protein n=1 Tax=Rhizophagus irregularis TaxID=588596 RepID=UPI0033308E85|nr:hypothetical protein OCT59_020106 [Rhizophagus irregularis]